MSFASRVALRWVDLDAQHHVNNALVADYLQQARVDWLLSGPNAHLLGDSTMVVGHQVEYLGPIFFDTEPVEVELLVGTVGASRFQLAYLVRQHGSDVARARSTLCLYDYRAQRVRRMTAAERGWFAAQSEPLEPLRSLGRWHVGEAAHVHDFTVRWSDLDSYGHANNVRVFDYFAEARIRMSPDGDNRMETAAAEKMTWMVARQDIDYLGQITLRREPYRVRSAVGQLGRTSMTIVAEIADAGRLYARARTVLVSGDASGRPIPLPEAMRTLATTWPAVPH